MTQFSKIRHMTLYTIFVGWKQRVILSQQDNQILEENMKVEIEDADWYAIKIEYILAKICNVYDWKHKQVKKRSTFVSES